MLVLDVFEDGVPPRFRLSAPKPARVVAASAASVETVRPDGARQVFAFDRPRRHSWNRSRRFRSRTPSTLNVTIDGEMLSGRFRGA